MAQPAALLIAGSEPRFAAEIDGFHTFLKPHCRVFPVMYHPTVRDLRAQLRVLFEETPATSPVLIAFSGHGSPHGWEARGVLKQLFYYETLVRMIRGAEHRVLVMNDCCYGQHLAAKAMHVADLGYRMSVLADWEGFDECHPKLITDAVASWSKQQFIENLCGGVSLSSAEHGDVDFPPLFRWGPVLDHHFFAPGTVAAA